MARRKVQEEKGERSRAGKGKKKGKGYGKALDRGEEKEGGG
jgi:hypothetical protein